MAASILNILILENGTTKTLTIYNPDVNVLWVESESDTLFVTMAITNHDYLLINFPDLTYLTTFLSDLTDALGTGGSGVVTLSNLGPVATTTTTSTTTTTTIEPTTTTTTEPAP